MDAQKYIEMLRDKHFIDLKKMEYKYSKEDVSEMLKLLYANDGNQLPLTDTGNQPLLYINSMVADTSTAMKSLMRYFGKDDYSLTAIEDEIVSTLSIEQIDTSRESVRNILTGLAPQNEAENRIAGMKKGFEFIADKSNRITAESVRYLYEIMINPFLEDQNDRLSANQLYRTGAVHIVNQTRNINVHDGMAHTKLSYHMDELFSFIHTADTMNDLHKAAAIHYYFAYLHPYFDGNGRMARMLHLWYLLQQGYSASLFLPFSSIIQKTKQDYYKAFDYTEKNALISNRLDI
ncbi:MAG: Fic family protein, partial [Peptococcaceae bacterium]|nr:Fic family protein [Peptococcaceae bacterium]